MPTNTTTASTSVLAELIQFAQSTLATLQAHEEWDSETNGAIGSDAIERGLAKTDEDDDVKFIVSPEAAQFPSEFNRKAIVQFLAEMRQECDKHGWDFGALDRKAYQQYLEAKGAVTAPAQPDMPPMKIAADNAAGRSRKR